VRTPQAHWKLAVPERDSDVGHSSDDLARGGPSRSLVLDRSAHTPTTAPDAAVSVVGQPKAREVRGGVPRRAACRRPGESVSESEGRRRIDDRAARTKKRPERRAPSHRPGRGRLRRESRGLRTGRRQAPAARPTAAPAPRRRTPRPTCWHRRSGRPPSARRRQSTRPTVIPRAGRGNGATDPRRREPSVTAEASQKRSTKRFCGLFGCAGRG
jgi:hypothetical protein